MFGRQSERFSRGPIFAAASPKRHGRWNWDRSGKVPAIVASWAIESGEGLEETS